MIFDGIIVGGGHSGVEAAVSMSKMGKKVKMREFKKSHEFIEIRDFSLFSSFCPEVAWEATLQRETVREM